MLSTFCNSLSDEAQLKLAIRLGKLALPAWNLHFCEDPVTINQLKELAREVNQLKIGGIIVDDGFPQKILVGIEKRYQAAKEKGGNPIVTLKGDATLLPFLTVSKKLLSHPEWELQLPESVRLVFVIAHNILVWILERRKNDEGHTLIYVAIHQASDVLQHQLMKSELEINTILIEYMDEKRSATEDTEWDAALPAGERAPIEMEVIPEVVEEKIYSAQSYEVLRQMREKGIAYASSYDEFFSGTSVTYCYNKEKQSYWRDEMDVIIGSFHHQIPMTEEEMLEVVSDLSVHDLRDSGFTV